MNAPIRQLVLVRHAKAEDPRGQADHDRRLTSQGQADAAALGIWPREHGIRPDEVLCSTSARTRETWAAAVNAAAIGALTEHDPAIYNASIDTLLDRLRLVPDTAHTVVLVGHAPGIPGLAAVLTQALDGSIASELHEYPTCTATVIRLELPWADLAPGAGELVQVHTSRAADPD
jgi:phosphohistidine phosphatase